MTCIRPSPKVMCQAVPREQTLLLASVTCTSAAGILPQLDMDLLMYIILGAATLIKVPVRAERLCKLGLCCPRGCMQVLLYFYCVALQHRSDSIMALAEVRMHVLRAAFHFGNAQP